MPENSKTRQSRADITSHYFCLHLPKGLVRRLEPHQQHALHAFKHKVVSGMHELYQAIPVETADKILDHYFKDPPPPTERAKQVVERAKTKS